MTLLGALISLAELGAFSPDNAKLLALPVSGFTVLLSKYSTARITINKKAPVVRLGLFHFIGSLAVYYSRMASATLPSSQLRFTSEFGMDSGGSTALLP